MIENLPAYISLLFLLTTLTTLFLLYLAVKKSPNKSTNKLAEKIIIGLFIWLIIQAVLTLNHVYSSQTNSLPPKIFLLGVLPTIIFIILLFVTQKGRAFIDTLPLKNLHYLHTIRIPVEIVLWWLFIHKTIPQIMTFEGRNFDIMVGITAPFIAYVGFTKSKLSKIILLFWNFISLGLLINIAVIGFLSAPSPLQQLAFEQPNIALLHFPFSWLVSIIVPIVLFAHLVSIKQLIQHK